MAATVTDLEKPDETARRGTTAGRRPRRGPLRRHAAARSVGLGVLSAVAVGGLLATVPVARTSPSGVRRVAFTPPLAATSWRAVRQYGAYGNNVYHDCSVAALADLEQTWNAETGRSGSPLSEKPILASYWTMTSGLDVGAYPSAVFAAWTRGVSGHRIDGVVAIASTRASLERAVALVGGAYSVVGLDPSDKPHAGLRTSQVASSPWWSLTVRNAAERPLVAHAVAVVGYDARFVYFVTWGGVQRATWRWWNARAIDSWAIAPGQLVGARSARLPLLHGAAARGFAGEMIVSKTAPAPVRPAI